jgi:hypothetical protein
LKAARRWAGITGFGSGSLFALLATFTHSKSATLLLLCLSFAGICFNQSMTFPICIDVAGKSPGSMAGALMWLKIDPTRQLVSATTLQSARAASLPEPEAP